MNSDELLKILACPACHGGLRLLRAAGKDAGFACDACAVVYPVQDDIPVMLLEEAIPMEKWNKSFGG